MIESSLWSAPGYASAGVQKINHWSHKKGLPHATWTRASPRPNAPGHVLGIETGEVRVEIQLVVKQFEDSWNSNHGGKPLVVYGD